ncbi:MAG: heme-binding protein [Candidatus Hydrogenedentes bacterium]|nr:heme-binding protein [Candidatus Hydrogenedentota bacterium]
MGYTSTKDIETPQYSVIREADGYEIRECAGYIRAEVTLQGAYRETLYAGFREVAPRQFAVLEFGGYATERRAQRKIERLQEALDRDGVVTAGNPIVAQHDPPWTPFCMRHNEIQAPVE